MSNLNWYLFDQNNSGGSFIVNDKVCHRLFIEAESFDDAVEKAEELGCYWDGVADGRDCPCCGDRWYQINNTVDIEKYKTEGYTVSLYGGIWSDTKSEWENKYRKYGVIEEPRFETRHTIRSYIGKIRFNSIEEYAQYLANEYGWTVPDGRIYYNNGNVKEIFNEKFEH